MLKEYTKTKGIPHNSRKMRMFHQQGISPVVTVENYIFLTVPIKIESIWVG